MEPKEITDGVMGNTSITTSTILLNYPIGQVLFGTIWAQMRFWISRKSIPMEDTRVSLMAGPFAAGQVHLPERFVFSESILTET